MEVQRLFRWSDHDDVLSRYGRDVLEMKMIRRKFFVVLVFACVLSMAADANAYVDPNLGGPLYQLIFPVFVAAVLFGRYLRQRARLWWVKCLWIPKAWKGNGFDS